PRAGLHERVDEEIATPGGSDDQSIAPPLLVVVTVLLDIHALLGHREIAVRRFEIRGEPGSVEACGELVQVVETLAHEPEEEVGVAARADRAVRTDQHALAIADLANQRSHLLTISRSLGGGPEAPFGPHPVEGEADMLARRRQRRSRVPHVQRRGHLGHDAVIVPEAWRGAAAAASLPAVQRIGERALAQQALLPAHARLGLAAALLLRDRDYLGDLCRPA